MFDCTRFYRKLVINRAINLSEVHVSFLAKIITFWKIKQNNAWTFFQFNMDSTRIATQSCFNNIFNSSWHAVKCRFEPRKPIWILQLLPDPSLQHSHCFRTTFWVNSMFQFAQLCHKDVLRNSWKFFEEFSEFFSNFFEEWKWWHSVQMTVFRYSAEIF